MKLLGAVPFPMVGPHSEDFPCSGLRCDIEISSFDPKTIATTITYSFSSDEIPELQYLDGLCNRGQAKRVLYLESPHSLHRSVADADQAGILRSRQGFLFGRVTLTPFIIATADMGDYRPPNTNLEWGDSSFTVHKGDVIAAGESQRFDIRHRSMSRRAMIDLQHSEEIDPEVYRIDAEGDVIVVLAGTEIRRAIEVMSKDPTYRPALYMSLYKDVLQQGLLQARDLDHEPDWLKSLESHLEIDSLEDLKDDDIWEEPQRLLFNLGAKRLLAEVDSV
jgi:hypothetical protein